MDGKPDRRFACKRDAEQFYNREINNPTTGASTSGPPSARRQGDNTPLANSSNSSTTSISATKPCATDAAGRRIRKDGKPDRRFANNREAEQFYLSQLIQPSPQAAKEAANTKPRSSSSDSSSTTAATGTPDTQKRGDNQRTNPGTHTTPLRATTPSTHNQRTNPGTHTTPLRATKPSTILTSPTQGDGTPPLSNRTPTRATDAAASGGSKRNATNNAEPTTTKTTSLQPLLAADGDSSGSDSSKRNATNNAEPTTTKTTSTPKRGDSWWLQSNRETNNPTAEAWTSAAPSDPRQGDNTPLANSTSSSTTSISATKTCATDAVGRRFRKDGKPDRRFANNREAEQFYLSQLIQPSPQTAKGAANTTPRSSTVTPHSQTRGDDQRTNPGTQTTPFRGTEPSTTLTIPPQGDRKSPPTSCTHATDATGRPLRKDGKPDRRFACNRDAEQFRLAQLTQPLRSADGDSPGSGSSKRNATNNAEPTTTKTTSTPKRGDSWWLQSNRETNKYPTTEAWASAALSAPRQGDNTPLANSSNSSNTSISATKPCGTDAAGRRIRKDGKPDRRFANNREAEQFYLSQLIQPSPQAAKGAANTTPRSSSDGSSSNRSTTSATVTPDTQKQGDNQRTNPGTHTPPLRGTEPSATLACPKQGDRDSPSTNCTPTRAADATGRPLRKDGKPDRSFACSHERPQLLEQPHREQQRQQQHERNEQQREEQPREQRRLDKDRQHSLREQQRVEEVRQQLREQQKRETQRQQQLQQQQECEKHRQRELREQNQREEERRQQLQLREQQHREVERQHEQQLQRKQQQRQLEQQQLQRERQLREHELLVQERQRCEINYQYNHHHHRHVHQYQSVWHQDQHCYMSSSGHAYTGSAHYRVSSQPTGPLTMSGHPDMRYKANRM
jgi:hypothetical protein